MAYWLVILIGLVGGVSVGMQTPIGGAMGTASRRNREQFHHPSQRDDLVRCLFVYARR